MLSHLASPSFPRSHGYVMVESKSHVSSSSPVAGLSTGRELKDTPPPRLPPHDSPPVPPGAGIEHEFAAGEEKKLKSSSTIMVRAQGKPAVLSKGQMDIPPALETTPKVHHRYRFRSTTALAGQSITFANLVGALGSICTVAATKVRTWASSIKIDWVKIWLPGNVTGGPDYCFIDWAASGNINFVPDYSKIMTLPDGVSVTGHLTFAPPKESLASMWLNTANLSASGAVLGITCPVGSIIDISMMYTLGNVSGGLDVTIASGSVGTIYYLALDGPSSNKLVPLGLPTTS